MAITKILARRTPVGALISYILNDSKTDDQLLTAGQRCTPDHAARRMEQTKRRFHQTGGVQCYHIIQSFQPGEITPEQALQLGKTFAARHLLEYEVVVATHTDRHHIHNHLVFNSVNCVTGRKYHSTPQTYCRQIRAISDQLCREQGLSVIMEPEQGGSMSYIEWLRQSKGQPTFRTLLEADLRESIEAANDLGHFFLLMEHRGYEIRHGSRLGFRLQGQERFRYPGRRDSLFTENGIRDAINGNLQEIAAGRKAVIAPRPRDRPYQRHPRYTGLLALYHHYLYLLGRVGRRQYPPRMTAHLRQEVMRFDQYREQFAFLQKNGITTVDGVRHYQQEKERELSNLTKQRTICNVHKKRRQELFTALADAEALAPVQALYEQGLSGVEEEYARWREAEQLLNTCGVPRAQLMEEKEDVYRQLAEVNRQITEKRGESTLCSNILSGCAAMERDIQAAEHSRHAEREVKRDEHRRR